mmetsp:Transcript_21153/g.55046  ORF Transcript_21153/g.55046 Transcript_21153/m.55046 type:complete len:854 (+) Transcript_21153:207-2768(+)
MDVDVRFFDENGTPIVFEAWAGREADSFPPCPVPKTEPHRYRLTSRFLRDKGFSVTRSENFEQLAATLTAAIPWLQPGLAVGRVVSAFSYNGDEVQPDQLVGDVYQVKRSGGGASLSRFGELGALDVQLLVYMMIGLPSGKVLRVEFDECPEAIITAADVKAAVAGASGLQPSMLHLVRTFPTLRPVRFVDEQRLFGYKGEMDRGLYTKRPYPGPVRPATIPTPPGMRFEVFERSEVEFLEQEEDWWDQLNRQVNWFGHREEFAAGQSVLKIRLNPPRQPQYYCGGAGGEAIHDRQLQIVKGPKGKPLCTPDTSTLHGLATMHKDVRSKHHELNGEVLYLPTPAEAKQEGIAFLGHERGKAFGDAAVTWLDGTTLQAQYCILYEGDRDLRVCIVSEESSTPRDPPQDAKTFVIEHKWDGAISRGAAGVVLFKGVYHAHAFTDGVDRDAIVALPRAVHDCLKMPFAVFQKTQADTIPDVVHSKIGRRKAGLTDRLFTVISRNGPGGSLAIKRVGKAGVDECSAADFFDGLALETRIVFASILARDLKSGSETIARVLVVWCDSVGTFTMRADGHLLGIIGAWTGPHVSGNSFDAVQHQLGRLYNLSAVHIGEPQPAQPGAPPASSGASPPAAATASEVLSVPLLEDVAAQDVPTVAQKQGDELLPHVARKDKQTTVAAQDVRTVAQQQGDKGPPPAARTAKQTTGQSKGKGPTVVPRKKSTSGEINTQVSAKVEADACTPMPARMSGDDKGEPALLKIPIGSEESPEMPDTPDTGMSQEGAAQAASSPLSPKELKAKAKEDAKRAKVILKAAKAAAKSVAKEEARRAKAAAKTAKAAEKRAKKESREDKVNPQR